MEKELKNLTPEMGEELRTLGVEFENTQDVWRKQLTDWKGRESREYLKHYGRYINDAIFQRGMESYETLPCPNLLELLDKLPEMHFVKGNPAWIKLDKLAGIWYISYVCADNVTSRTFKHKSLLIATFELSKWVFGERKALYNLSKEIKGGSHQPPRKFN